MYAFCVQAREEKDPDFNLAGQPEYNESLVLETQEAVARGNASICALWQK